MLNVRTRPPVNSIRTAALAATVIALVAVLSLHVPGASAHARYDHSTPGDGEVLATAPAKVDVFFAEEVQRANGLPTLVVVDDNGDSVDKGSVLDDSDRTHISDELNSDLPDGRYAVIWHTVSTDDGEEAQGAFYFYVGAAPTLAPSGGAASSTAKATGTPVASTPPATTNDDSDDDIPIWGLIVGIIGGAVVGVMAGAVIGRRSSS